MCQISYPPEVLGKIAPERIRFSPSLLNHPIFSGALSAAKYFGVVGTTQGSIIKLTSLRLLQLLDPIEDANVQNAHRF